MRRHAKALIAALTLLGSLVAGVTLAQGNPPTVSIDPPTEVKFASAHVSGTVDPEDNETFCSFEYAIDPDTEDWSAVACEASVPAGSGPTEVKADLGGLKPGATYRVRLAANNLVDPEVVSSEETFETEAVNPPEASGVQVSAITSSSAHIEGTVNSGGTNPGEKAGSYRFQCSPSCDGIGGEHEFDAEGLADGSDHPVQADVTGLQPHRSLQPHRKYTITLIATNVGGKAEAQQSFTSSAVAPEIAPALVWGAGPGAWVIRAELNPHNSEVTDCHFEFGPTTSYGQSLPCEELSGDQVNELTPVGHTISGLAPSSTYHFRLVAQTADGGPAVLGEDAILETPAQANPSNCANEAIREEQHSTYLPDCRAYEIVSPLAKNGADIGSYSARTRAAANGDAVSFMSLSGFGDIRATGTASEYVGVRDGQAPTGWSTHAIAPGPLVTPTFAEGAKALESHYVDGFSADLQQGVFLTKTPLTPDSPNTDAVPKLYLLRGLLTPGAKQPQLITDCPACSAPLKQNPTAQPGFAAASADYGHLLFESEQSLTADIPNCEPVFGHSSESQCPLHLYEWSDGTLRLAGVLPDGTAAPNSQAGGGASSVTAFVSNGNHAYTPNIISRDGSRYFFTVRGADSRTSGELYMRIGNSTATPATVQVNASEKTLPDAPEEATYMTATPDGSKVFFTSPEQLTDTPGSGLYMYDASRPDGEPDNLTLIHSGSVNGVIGASEDGSYVYFLTSPKSPRLMLAHDGEVRQLATVADEQADFLSGGGSYVGNPKASRVTPDGRHMIFVSLGRDSLPHSGVGDTCLTDFLQRCTEVYAYDAAANGGEGQLDCVSCTQPPSAPATTNAAITTEAGRGLAVRSRPLNNPLSDDGRYAFFHTGESLVPQDTNGVEDVYSYDTATGETHLLSSGIDPASSYFMDASRDGHDVFFTTRARLSGWDVDESYDLYDARVGGGLSEPPPQPAPCAAIQDCRQLAPRAPAPPGEATAAFNGPPNRKHCSKGKAHRHGRCVKRQPRKHRSKRAANANRGGAK